MWLRSRPPEAEVNCVYTLWRDVREWDIKSSFVADSVCRGEVGKMTACWLYVVLLSSGCTSPLPTSRLSLHTQTHTPPHHTLPPEARLWSLWILIHCTATECAQHRSENIWQALFIDPAGGQAESTATRSSLFWSRVPQKSPWRKELQSPGARSITWPWRGRSFFYRMSVAIVGGECCCGVYRWKRDTC